MTIAEKIVKTRLDSGLSESEFAEKLGISETALKCYESGEIIADDDLRIKISTEFSLPSDEFCLSESERQQLNAETPVTIDQKLPYNPYAQQIPPAPVLKDKLFNSATLKTIIFPWLLMLLVYIPFSVLLVIPTFMEQINQVVFPDSYLIILSFLESLFITIFSPVFLYLVGKKQYNKVFIRLETHKNLSYAFPLFVASVDVFSRLIDAILNDLFTISGLNNTQKSYYEEQNLLRLSSSVVFTFIALATLIITEYFFIKHLFNYIDNSNSEEPNTKATQKIFNLFTILTAVSLIFTIAKIVIGNSETVSIVKNILYFLIDALICVVWYKLYKTPECKSNKKLMTVLPYVIFWTPMAISAASQTVHFIMTLVKTI